MERQMVEERNYTVYKHTCPNGKIYIGITRRNPVERWDRGYGYMHNRRFFQAIKKYGWDNIKHEILYSYLTSNEASEKEKELIKKFHSNNEEYGYNYTEGGLGYNGFTGDQLRYEKLPSYCFVKSNKFALELFNEIVRIAKPHDNSVTIVKYDDDGSVILKTTKKVSIKPDILAVHLLIDSYSECEELKELIDELKRIAFEAE